MYSDEEGSIAPDIEGDTTTNDKNKEKYLHPKEWGDAPEDVWVAFKAAATPSNRLVGKKNMNKSWSGLTPTVRKNSINRWNRILTQAQRDTILAQASLQLPLPEGPSVFASRDEDCSNHNNDDKARLIHIRNEPRLVRNWERIFSSKDRLELDDRAGMAHVDPWIDIVQAFNDYENFQYTNPSVDRRDKSKPKNESARAVFNRVGDWDPSNAARPDRDSAWMRKWLGDIRSDFSISCAAFGRSGDHDAENLYDQYTLFDQGSDMALYAMVVWGTDTPVALSSDRRLPFETTVDLAIVPSAQEEIKPSKQGKSGVVDQSRSKKGKRRLRIPSDSSSLRSFPKQDVSVPT